MDWLVQFFLRFLIPMRIERYRHMLVWIECELGNIIPLVAMFPKSVQSLNTVL